MRPVPPLVLALLLLVPAASALVEVTSSSTAGFARATTAGAPTPCTAALQVEFLEARDHVTVQRTIVTGNGDDARCALLPARELPQTYEEPSGSVLRSGWTYSLAGSSAGAAGSTHLWAVVIELRLTSAWYTEYRWTCTAFGSCSLTLELEGILFGPAARVGLE